MDQLSFNDRYVVKLDIFEGPLDLLLHLIRKHELDIFDIPISFVTTKYLDYLDMMKQLNLDLASEYLDMASTLTLIKSRMLLPSEPNLDEEDLNEGPDPREELIRRLLEYQKYKTAASALAGRPMLGRDTFPHGHTEQISVERELASPGLFSLMEAFKEVLSRSDIDDSHNVSVTRITVSERVNEIVDILRRKRQLTFEALFEGQTTRTSVVVTFLSILEMTRLGLIQIHQAGIHSDIHIAAESSIEEGRQILTHQLMEE